MASYSGVYRPVARMPFRIHDPKQDVVKVVQSVPDTPIFEATPRKTPSSSWSRPSSAASPRETAAGVRPVDPRMLISTRIAFGLTVLASLALTACGDATKGGGPGNPGGGGGGAFKTTAGPNGGVIGGLNSELSLTFSKTVDPASVDLSAIQIVTVNDATGLSSVPAGIVASVQLEVSGTKVTIRPTVTFSPSNIEYGFVAKALYEISFAGATSGNSVESTSGDILENPDVTYFFRTPTKGSDGKPGFPKVRAFFVDSLGGLDLPEVIADSDANGDAVAEALALLPGADEILTQTPTKLVPTAPVKEIAFLFDEAVIPESVVNVLDGSSPTISVLFNTVALPGFAPKVAPATLQLFHQQNDLTIVRWVPAVQAFPPNGFLFVQVNGLVQDLACNSKLSLSGSGDPSLFIGVLVDSAIDEQFDPIVEPFTNDANEDENNSSADWANSFPGLLGPVFGGGSGTDGKLILDDTATSESLGTSVFPIAAVVDIEARELRLPTVRQVSDGVFEPRAWEFSKVDIPTSWTVKVLTDRDDDDTPDPEEFIVQSPGHPLDGLGAPLVLRSSGNFTLGGTVDVSGVSAVDGVRPPSEISALYADFLGVGAPGAEPLLAAGNGGRGGDSLLLSEGDVALPLVSPPGGGFQAADANGVIRGVTGRSTGLSSTILTDANRDLSVLNTDGVLSAALAAGEILIQPNVGVGSQQLGNAGTNNVEIDENHPMFVVKTVEVTGGVTKITVQPENGSLTQVSDNVGNDYAPIAAAGDSYLLGRFAGSQGGDATPLGRGGLGAQPYMVVNATAITTTGGGAGGGGGFEEGSKGGTSGPEANPLTDQRGTSNGMSLDESAGAEGGLGAIAGSARVMSDIELDVLSQSAGLDLAGLTGTALEGSLLIPNSEFDGWMFRVESFDGTTLVIDRIVSDAVDIGLSDGPGANGPGLGVGVVVDFLIVPRLDIGGAGGGGSGASITGSLNFASSSLPTVTPGAGAGAGGGSVVLETASTMIISSTAQVLARGGNGASFSDTQGTRYAGGGGGAGGNIVIRGGSQLSIFEGAVISALGGEGGGVDGFGRGGAGGGGFIRIENSKDTLSAVLLSAFTQPPVGEPNVGRSLGDAQGVGRSKFYDTMLVNTAYTRIEVDYVADTNGDSIVEEFTWAFDEMGSDGGTAGILNTPFDITLNTVPANEQGFLDTNVITEFFVAPSDLIGGRTGFVWDDVDDVLLYVPGIGTSEIHRLNADLTPATPATIPMPFIVSEGANEFDIVSIAVNAAEIYLLEAGTGRVIVLNRAGVFQRIVTLPKAVSGAMAIDGAGSLLVIDNIAGTLDFYASIDPGAAEPQLTSFTLTEAQASSPILRDDLAVSLNVTGMALDPTGTLLWCVDATTSEIFVLTLGAGGTASSTTGIEPSGFLELASGDGILPSSVAFDGTSLFLVNAVAKDDTSITTIAPGDIGSIGAPVVVAEFGPQAPEGAQASGDGDQFVRFEITLDPDAVDNGTTFDLVRIDEVRIVFENKSF